jgi:acetyl-CoA carboxylase beta subunit
MEDAMDGKRDPLKHEELYFQQQERAAIEKLRKEREAKLSHKINSAETAQIEALKAAHWMRCPKCGHEMEQVDLSSVAVDRCTRCEGVFFDRGEMEDLFLKKQDERRNIFRKLIGI